MGRIRVVTVDRAGRGDFKGRGSQSLELGIVNRIGQGLAQARGMLTKHAVKQVDRMLSNTGGRWGSCLRNGVESLSRAAAGEILTNSIVSCGVKRTPDPCSATLTRPA